MTNIYNLDPKLDRDRVLGTDMITSEVRQFRKLSQLALSDADIAHRMAISISEVKNIRKLIGGSKTRLMDLPIKYHTRLLLGSNGIKTLGDLLAKTDAELLSIGGIGQKTLQQLKQVVCDYMRKET